jgi:hypothetical protein
MLWHIHTKADDLHMHRFIAPPEHTPYFSEKLSYMPESFLGPSHRYAGSLTATVVKAHSVLSRIVNVSILFSNRNSSVTYHAAATAGRLTHQFWGAASGSDTEEHSTGDYDRMVRRMDEGLMVCSPVEQHMPLACCFVCEHAWSRQTSTWPSIVAEVSHIHDDMQCLHE